MRIQRMRFFLNPKIKEKTNTFNLKESRAFHQLTDGPRNRQISALFHFFVRRVVVVVAAVDAVSVDWREREAVRMCRPRVIPLGSSSTKKIMTKITGISITGRNEGAINRSSIQYSFLSTHSSCQQRPKAAAFFLFAKT